MDVVTTILYNRGTPYVDNLVSLRVWVTTLRVKEPGLRVDPGPFRPTLCSSYREPIDPLDNVSTDVSDQGVSPRGPRRNNRPSVKTGCRNTHQNTYTYK